MDDEQFLGYVSIHSKTDLALFSVGHIKRLHDLAGVDLPSQVAESDSQRGFLKMSDDYSRPLVDKARVRMRGQGEAAR